MPSLDLVHQTPEQPALAARQTFGILGRLLLEQSKSW
jgi:hypothetical protein